MPSPTRRTLTGTIQNSDATIPAGKNISFTLQATLTDAAGNVLVSTEKITKTLDSSGVFSVSLVSDSGDVMPQPVYEVWEGFGETRKYNIVIPAGSGSVDLSDLAPVGPSPTPPSAYALLSVMEAADAAVLAAAEAYTDTHGGTGTGTVQKVAGVSPDGTGNVPLTAANVGADASGAATAAQAAAVATAATDATTKANAAQAAAIAASQPVDSDLTAIAALSTTAYGRAFLALADAAAGRTALGLGTAATQASTAFDAAGAASTAQAAAIAAAATDATTKANAAQAASQPLDSDLTAIAALATTTYGRSLLAAVDAAALRTLAGLGTAATANKVAAGSAGVLDATDPTTTNSRTPTAHAHPESDVTSLVTDLAGKTPLLTPTATKTVAYTAVVGDLAMMNVAGGGTPLTLPTTPADKSIVGFRAMGATAAVPLVVNAGGADTIGTAGLTTTSVQLADEETFLQYQASGTRWLAISNVKTQASLDGRYLLLSTVTTKGDLLAATAASTVARVGVGSDGQVLTADAASTPGVKWAAVSAQVRTSSEGAHSGLYYTPPMPSSALSSAANTVGLMTAIPIVMPSCTLSQIGLRVLTLAASSLIRVGIYSDDGTGYPGALLLDAGQISGAATGLITANISQAVAGLIWLAGVNQTGTPTVQTTTLTNWGLGVDSANALNAIGGNSFSGYSQTGVTAALPANFTTTVTVLGAGAMRMIVKV